MLTGMDLLSFILHAKTFVTESTHIQRDALHIHLGIGIFLVMALLLRGQRRFFHAWLVLVVITLAGEAFDTIGRLSDGQNFYLPGFVKDLVNTLLWPTVLCFGGSRVGRLFGLSVSDRMQFDPRGQR